MAEPTMKTVALVGMGVIGRSWIQVFARAGCRVSIYDKDPSQVQMALSWLEENLKQDVADGFITAQEAEARHALVSANEELKGAVDGAEYIQESGPENLKIKQAIFAEIDKVVNPSAIIGSSSSSLDINEIAAHLPGISRCFLAHPVHPPHVIPAVEIMPAKGVDPEVTRRMIEFLRSAGQKPFLVKHHVVGIVLSRIHSAVLREALHLVETGVADVDAIDTCIRDGLGLRYALLGIFGVNNLGADGGVREYYSRFHETYLNIWNDFDPTPPTFDPDMIERIGKEVDIMEGDAPLSEISRWRDHMIRKMRALKEEDPHP